MTCDGLHFVKQFLLKDMSHMNEIRRSFVTTPVFEEIVDGHDDVVSEKVDMNKVVPKRKPNPKDG